MAADVVGDRWAVSGELAEFNGIGYTFLRPHLMSQGIIAPIAQWIEQVPSKHKVVGSNPAGGARTERRPLIPDHRIRRSREALAYRRR